jgi:hypothetical protein
LNRIIQDLSICSCQSEWQTQEKQIKALHEEAVEAWQRPILKGAAYVDAEHDQVDGPPDEGLSTSTTGKAGMG